MINIRKAIPTDVDLVHAMGEKVSEFSVNEETIIFWPQEILSKAAVSDDVLFLVAEIDQRVVGFIIANLNFSLQKALIENVYVTLENRDGDVGKKLLDALLAHLNDTPIEYVATLIPLGAAGASKLYTSAGFSKGETFLWLDKLTTDKFKAT